jgi:hypothetical protein
VKFQVDISGFGQVVKGLQKITGKSFKEVLEAEAGHILTGAIRLTPKATAKKVTKRTMPEGYAFKNYVGGRKVTWDEGKRYHVGEPVPSGQGKRGGIRYKYPQAQWMGKKGRNNGRWARYVETQKAKTAERILKRGLSASQFYWMGVLLNIKFPKTPAKYIRDPKHAQKVVKYLSPRKGARGKLYEILMQSKGFKMSKRLQMQSKILRATKSRETFFMRAVKKEFVKDLKTFMPKNYPLLFK